MNDSPVMSSLNRSGQDLNCSSRLFRRLGIAGQMFRKASASNELHRKKRQAVMLPDLVYLNDVWMLKPRNCLCLSTKTRTLFTAGVLCRHDRFQCNDAVESKLTRAIHNAHTATTYLSLQLIPGNVRQPCRSIRRARYPACYVHVLCFEHRVHGF